MDHAVRDMVTWIGRAPTLEQISAERQGVEASLVKAMARELGLPAVRFFEMIGVPRATAEKRAAARGFVDGVAGQAALGVASLMRLTKEMAEASTAPEAKTFDATRWLGQWLEAPSPALRGMRPGDMLDTPTGRRVVHNLLGSVISGSYQ
jgi:uncharacterized protein (DUF2384 family)